MNRYHEVISSLIKIIEMKKQIEREVDIVKSNLTVTEFVKHSSFDYDELAKCFNENKILNLPLEIQPDQYTTSSLVNTDTGESVVPLHKSNKIQSPNHPLSPAALNVIPKLLMESKIR